MPQKKTKTTAAKKRGRVKTDSLEKPAKEMKADDMKRVRGGLQQIQQTLSRVNETVTQISKENSEAQKSVTQNLSV